MKFKSVAASIIQTQFNSKIKCIRTDNGNEFLLKDFYNANGILHQTKFLCWDFTTKWNSGEKTPTYS